MINPVRQLASKIIKKAKDVRINKGKMKELADNWKKEKISAPEWFEEFHFRSLDYFIILDSLNFCFWSLGDKKWEIEYENKKYTGYFALSLSLKRFFEDNPEKANLKYFSNISKKEFISILQGGENLQFLNKRWEITRKVSREIIRKYGNSQNFISSCDGLFSNLILKIKNLPGFNDPFLKRAQILACDIYGAGLGQFLDLDYPTTFADYKVPQILNYFGIIEYSDYLDEKIKNKILIPKNSRQEKEIRAATILAVDMLAEELGNLHPFEVDWILWGKAQFSDITKPYHLTKTICY